MKSHFLERGTLWRGNSEVSALWNVKLNSSQPVQMNHIAERKDQSDPPGGAGNTCLEKLKVKEWNKSKVNSETDFRFCPVLMLLVGQDMVKDVDAARAIE